MLCFQLLDDVLQDAYRAIPAKSDVERVGMIQSQKDYLYEQYRQLDNPGTCICYDDAATRFAYLYRYAGVRADFIYQMASRYQAIREILSRRHIRVACVGGGPGTELIGLAKYAVHHGKCATISAQILDKVQVWRNSWETVCRHMKPCIRGCTEISAVYVETDVYKADTISDSLADVDLYTLSYFASEFRAHQEEAGPFMRALIRTAKPGALFVILEIDHSKDYNWLDSNFEGFARESAAMDRQALTLSDKERERLRRFFPKLPGGWRPHPDPKTIHRVYKKTVPADLPQGGRRHTLVGG